MEEEILLKRILSNRSFEEVKQNCDKQYHHSSCRTIFGINNETVYYRCKTCQNTWDAVICDECFKKGDHKNHEWFLQKVEKIGICDCGKNYRWKSFGNCNDHNHSNNFQNINQNQSESEIKEMKYLELLPEYLQNNYVNEIKNLLKQLFENIELYNQYKGKLFKKSVVFYHQTEIMKYLHVIEKLNEIDLLFCINCELMRNEQMIGKIVENCFGDDEIVCDECSKLLLTIISDERNVNDIYLQFIQLYISLHENFNLLQKMNGDLLNVLSRQILSCVELNERIFFENEELVLKIIDIIKRYIQNNQIMELDDDMIYKMDCFVQQFCGMISKSVNVIMKKKTIVNRLVDLLEVLTFFNMELRLTKEHKEYENDIDLKIRFICDEITTVWQRCIDYFKEHKDNEEEQKDLKELLNEMIKRYTELQSNHIQKKIEEIDIGKNQSIGMYYHLETIISYALASIQNPFEYIQEIDQQNQLLLYPLIYQQFLMEMNYNNKIWIRNGISIVNKTNVLFSQYSDQLMNDMYLFQLSTKNNASLLINQLKYICRLSILEQLTPQQKIDSILKEQITAGMLCILRLIYNIIVDPLFSCQLTREEMIIYIMIHVIMEEKYSINELFQKIPQVCMRMVDFNADSVIKELIEIKNNKYHLKEKYMKYINPYSFYISLQSSQLLEEKLGNQRHTKREIYKEQRRSEEMTISLIEFLHNEEVTKIILFILQKGGLVSSISTDKDSQRLDSRILILISQLLKLRMYYPPLHSYSEIHMKLIEEISNEIIQVDKDQIIIQELYLMKEQELLQQSIWLKSIIDQTKHFVEGKDTVEKKKEEQKRKQMKIKKQMEEKQKSILQHNNNLNNNNVKQNDQEKEESQRKSFDPDKCIVCQNDDTLTNERIGYLCHIEMSDALRYNQFYEQNPQMKGCIKNGKWIQPQSMQTNQWKKIERTENDFYRILSFCPHKIHYKCYKAQYEYQINEENYYLKNTIYCPICGTLSTIFIEEQPTVFIQSSECSFDFSSICESNSINYLNRQERIERVEHIIKDIQEMKELIEPLSESEERTLESSLTRTIRNEEITISLYEMAFESILSVIVSTIMTIELDSRGKETYQYEEKIHILNWYLSLAKKIRDRVSKDKRISMISQFMTFDTSQNEKQRLIQFLECILLDSSSLSLYVFTIHMHHFLHFYSSILEKSNNINEKIMKDINNHSLPFFKYLQIIRNILLNSTSFISFEQIQQYTLNDIHQIKSIIENELINTKQYQMVSTKSLSLPQHSQQFSMIVLPETYTELLNTVLNSKCTICGIEGKNILQNSAICMHCGCLTCYYEKKKENKMIHSKTPVFEHQNECCGEVGMYLIIDTASLLIIAPQYHSIVRNIYINEFGESPKIMLTKGLFKLNRKIIEKIERLYLNGQITSSPELIFEVKRYH